MNAKPHKNGHLPSAAGRAFLAGLLLASTLALAGENPADAPAQRWATPENDLLLYVSRLQDSYRVCPDVPGAEHQPFCRDFEAELLSMCGHRDALQLVLANGEVHRVNGALIGIDGSFEPAHRPDQSLDLASAWFPAEECDVTKGLAEVVAADTAGHLWLFDGSAWQVIRQKRLGAKRWL